MQQRTSKLQTDNTHVSTIYSTAFNISYIVHCNVSSSTYSWYTSQ